ncbi:hypothetical protein F0562_003439 [Nyssa sinensis]|uniref:Uncharacterized protein n=1 Tax=Nyssa sinensis TaxID=561372 RepID=A0A5J5BYJ1_9ASTE|nr:hypothetical protein F0562_003439 [Nyssa sinensis]
MEVQRNERRYISYVYVYTLSACWCSSVMVQQSFNSSHGSVIAEGAATKAAEAALRQQEDDQAECSCIGRIVVRVPNL